MTDKPVTVWNPPMVAELSEGYKIWAFGGTGQGFLTAMEEVQRLCEVIVGLREQCRGMEIRETAGNGIIIEQTATIDRQARELEQLRADLEFSKQAAQEGGRAFLQASGLDQRGPVQAQPRIIGGHHEGCDVFQPSPDLGPSHKPCNCRAILAAAQPSVEVVEPCTGAEFADAAFQAIDPRTDEEIRDIIADVEGEPVAQPSGEGTGR